MDDDNTGLKSGWPTAAIPYSVSVPMTFGIATGQPYPRGRATGTGRR